MKLSCEIIKDLLPLYCDSICSEETKAAVEEHLTDCVSCSEELQKMKSNLPVTVLQKEEGGFIIGGYKMNLIRKGLMLSLCVFVLPLLNACLSLLFGESMFGYSFFITAAVLVSNVYIQKIKVKNRPAWLAASAILFPILMIAETSRFTNNGFLSVNLAALLSLIPIYIYTLFSIVKYAVGNKKEPLQPSQYKKTAIIFMICETAVLLYLSFVSTFRCMGGEFWSNFHTVVGLTFFTLAFIWLYYLFFKHFKRNMLFNTGVCIAVFGIYIVIYNMYENYLPYPFNTFRNTDLHLSLFLLITLCAVGAALMLIGILTEKKSTQIEQPEQSEHKEEEKEKEKEEEEQEEQEEKQEQEQE